MSVALVTGGNRGIGLEVCRQLAGHGHTVILGSRDRAKGEAVAGGLRVVALDVSDDASVRAAAAEIEELDILVNNAAILYDTWARGATADLAEVHEALETNLFGAWRTTQAFLPHLRRSAHPRVVNVSSASGSLTSMSGGTPAYSVSKAGLNALTRILASELPGMRVNAVCPGWTDTDMGQGGRPVEQGAASVVWAAELPDDGPTGGFFRDGRPLAW
ncbi:SDR family oxidoreductase [Solirubrobacter soli]|uniref:SDR family oxidoreductase n=1 Tax=Solirubrobacter soli TaxID=363832 RepID=UPI000413B946|nr:SDR family oxidoreductase [Solirubrobacter soli]